MKPVRGQISLRGKVESDVHNIFGGGGLINYRLWRFIVSAIRLNILGGFGSASTLTTSELIIGLSVEKK